MAFIHFLALLAVLQYLYFGVLVGRMLYGRAYVRDPASRGPGFIMAMVANVLLLLTGLLAILF